MSEVEEYMRECLRLQGENDALRATLAVVASGLLECASAAHLRDVPGGLCKGEFATCPSSRCVAMREALEKAEALQ